MSGGLSPRMARLQINDGEASRSRDSLASADSGTHLDPREERWEASDALMRRAGSGRGSSSLRGSGRGGPSRSHQVTCRWLRKEGVLLKKQSASGWASMTLNIRLTSTKEYEFTVTTGDNERSRIAIELIRDAADGVITLAGLDFDPLKMAEYLEVKFADSPRASPRAGRKGGVDSRSTLSNVECGRGDRPKVPSDESTRSV